MSASYPKPAASEYNDAELIVLTSNKMSPDYIYYMEEVWRRQDAGTWNPNQDRNED